MALAISGILAQREDVSGPAIYRRGRGSHIGSLGSKIAERVATDIREHSERCLETMVVS
jgi:hypothetical protein